MYAASSMEFQKSKEFLEIQLEASQSNLSKLHKEYQEFQRESLEIKTTLQNERSILQIRFNQSIRSPNSFCHIELIHLSELEQNMKTTLLQSSEK